jgi:hypothetical protein
VLTDAFDGWKIDGDGKPVAGGENRETTTEKQETTTETDAETDQPPLTREQRVADYRECIEGRGAEDVEVDEGNIPSVTFSGGGSPVQAAFGATPEDAKQGLSSVRKRETFYSGRFGTIVLYSFGDPLSDDLDAGLACAKQVGGPGSDEEFGAGQ